MTEVTATAANQQRLVTDFLEGGVAEACRLHRLSPEQLLACQHEDWWQEAAKAYYKSQAADTDRRLSKLINKALDETEERLEHGDEVIDRLGELHKLPMKGREVAGVAALLMEKRQNLRGLPDSIQRQDINLTLVAERLREIGAEASGLGPASNTRKGQSAGALVSVSLAAQELALEDEVEQQRAA